MHYVTTSSIRVTTEKLASRPPPRLKIRHRFLATCSIAAIIRRLWNTRRDRPEPATIFWRCMRPQNAAEVPFTFEDVVIVGRPFAAGSAFGGALEDQHGGGGADATYAAALCQCHQNTMPLTSTAAP